MSARNRNLLIVGAVLVLGAYLAGFIPQYGRASDLQGQLEEAQVQVRSLERSAALMRSRELAHLMHLEVAKRNYGLATQRAEEFFRHIQSVHAETEDETLKDGLRQLYAERDAVIADLSQAAPTTDERVRRVVERIHTLTQGG